MNLIKNYLLMNLDAPSAWGIYFQDSATPQMEGLIELHDNIMYYLVVILFAFAWIMISMIRTYISTKSPISHKYLNHGKIVPTQKCFKFNNMNFIKLYSTSSDVSVKFYEDAFSMRKLIIQDNKNKSGIYRWTNLVNNKTYIGSSINLTRRI